MSEENESNDKNGPITTPNNSNTKNDKFQLPKGVQIPDLNFDLKAAIQTGVNKTNAFLATLESQKVQTTSMVSSRLHPLINHLKYGAEQGMKYYEMRRYYGPQIVVGTASIVGLLVGSRRGKVPGVVVGGLSGVGAYNFVYGQTGIGKSDE